MEINSINLNELITKLILLNYQISFRIFGTSLSIIISKEILNNEINNVKIIQVVSIDYLNNINKMNILVNFMINKLEKNIIDNIINNENIRT